MSRSENGRMIVSKLYASVFDAVGLTDDIAILLLLVGEFACIRIDRDIGQQIHWFQWAHHIAVRRRVCV